ncbi:hypothetical protein, partial [Nocardia sp. NPDC019302]|uniref:hypothetical protein n=1 Tax=Nocardia sp. NPDC019302 TaxID=3154592 RepID=UPI0033F2232A
ASTALTGRLDSCMSLLITTSALALITLKIIGVIQAVGQVTHLMRASAKFRRTQWAVSWPGDQ